MKGCCELGPGVSASFTELHPFNPLLYKIPHFIDIRGSRSYCDYLFKFPYTYRVLIRLPGSFLPLQNLSSYLIVKPVMNNCYSLMSNHYCYWSQWELVISWSSPFFHLHGHMLTYFTCQFGRGISLAVYGLCRVPVSVVALRCLIRVCGTSRSHSTASPSHRSLKRSVKSSFKFECTSKQRQ